MATFALNSGVCFVLVFFMSPAPLRFGAGSPYHLSPWSELEFPRSDTVRGLRC
jgi:hypothetical protein